jgi:hypothetical protein
MSGEVRQALADAANTVPGIACQPFYVQATAAGASFVRLERIDYPNPFGGVAHWNVVVVLDQDMGHAERFLEEHLEPLRIALSEVLVVTSATPQRVSFPGVGDLPCVFINGHREAD